MLLKIRLILSKLSQLKLRGVVWCLNIYLHEVRIRFRLRWNAVRHPIHPTRGVTVVGHFGARDSLGKVARDLVFRLRDAGIPFQTFTLDDTTPAEFAAMLTPLRDFRTLKYDRMIDIYGSPFPNVHGVKRGSVLFWEFESGFPEAHPLHMGMNAIAMSDFNFTYFKKIYRSPLVVSKLLYPFRFDVGNLPGRNEIRRRFGIRDDAVVVFFNFDFGSSFGRKNPDGLMRAFAKAAKGMPNAVLLFKTMRGTPNDAEMLKRQATELGIADRFVHVLNYLATRDLYGLTAACDVYASLHRGEGFGLGIAEAMSLGVPVLITAYSAPMEFCNADNSVLVPFRMVAADQKQLGHICYGSVTEWADPDLDAAADALRRLLSDGDYRKRIGDSGRSSIANQFSIEAFRQSINAYLDAVS